MVIKEHEGYEDVEQEEEQEYTIDDNDNVKEGVGSGVMASDFDSERVLYEIKKTINGFDKRNGKYVRVAYPMARTDFVNLYINSLRSLLNFPNLFSQKSAKEAAFDMMEGLKEMTFAAVDYGVKEEHIETFINIYDTLKSTFYGIIVEGRGTENIKQVLTNVYEKLAKERDNNKEMGFINYDRIQKEIMGRSS